jgi:transposase-like protein
VRHFSPNSLDSKGGKEKDILKEKGSMIVHSDTTVKKHIIKAVPNPEVTERAVRRRFTAEYKLRILKEADACTKQGQLGALLRREGLYSSNLTLWRRQIDEGLVPKKRGPATRTPDPNVRRIAQLEKDTARLTHKLKQAELIIEVQKKVAALLRGLEKMEENS